VRSNLRGIEWPAIPDPPSAQLLALAWQLDQTQWWSAERLRAHQERQLRVLLQHAVTAPHYADRFAGLALDRIELSAIPVLSRDVLIAAGDRMLSRSYPAHHGTVNEVTTSRTTGAPVKVRNTEVVSLFWKAITLRDHAWHRRDLEAKLATIRYTAGEAKPPDGARSTCWGPATAALAPEAPLVRLSVESTTDEQIAWLLREDPTYLIVYPTVFEAIARRLAVGANKLPALREVRTVSEALSAETRTLCRDVLGVPLVDMYSAQEVGYIALQCPLHPHYHVQAESVLVEVVGDDGAPCRAGDTGRVLLTDLHNFATPLIRYDIGDYAEVGAPCRCGRGLPTLTKIVGRRRGMLRYADGRTVWPVFTVACRTAARYREIQLVQESLERLKLRVVAEGTLDPAAPAALIAALRDALGPFEIAVEVVEQLGRSPAGKLEEFVSLV